MKPWEWDDAPLAYYYRAPIWSEATAAVRSGETAQPMTEEQLAPFLMSKEEAKRILNIQD